MPAAPRDVSAVLQELLAAALRARDREPAVRAALGTGAGEIQQSLYLAVLGLAGVPAAALAGTSPPSPLADIARLTPFMPEGVASRLARTLAPPEEDLAEGLGRIHESLLELRVCVRAGGRISIEPSLGRRRSGAHYTPRELSARLVERTLSPLCAGKGSHELLELRICDPAMGAGAMLLEAARFVGGRLAAARRREGAPRATPEESLADVTARCLYGVDRDPLAQKLALFVLSRVTSPGAQAARDLDSHLLVGDALSGEPGNSRGRVTTPWTAWFPAIFAEPRAGFDACVGNPPWVSYVGRAAQPLDDETFRHYARTNPAFRGYRTLHGLFVRRTAELLRDGGRMGLVLPTSVADLTGYTATREAHDALCDADPDLLDFGDGSFEGVFQPCMGLTSTRRSAPHAGAKPGGPWPLASTLGEPIRRLIARLSALPPLPSALFGERGYQTARPDARHFSERRQSRFTLPLHEGIDVGELSLSPPHVFADPESLSGRLRPAHEWKQVSVFIRQTARYPIATLSDGNAFRNSILAGFSSEEWTGPALAAYLNSLAVRFYHYTRQRDAREGMPQLKIGHLRSLPAVADPGARRALHDLCVSAMKRGGGLDPASRSDLDDVVFTALGLQGGERELVREWAAANPVPRPRKRPRPAERPDPAS